MINSQIKKRFLEIISIIIGFLFITIGGFLIYSYLQTIMISQNQSDQSEIFWHLPIMFIGTVLFGSGLYFSFIVYKSVKGNKKASGLIRTSLKSLIVVLLFLAVIILLVNI